MVHLQLVEFCCGAVGFIDVSPRLDKFFFKVVIDGVGWSRRCRNGHNPVLYTLLPFIGVRSCQVGEGMRNFAPWVLHEGMKVIHKLV